MPASRSKRRRFPPRVYAEIIARQNSKCACGCDEDLTDPRDIEFDHALDLQWGGEDTPENLRALKKRHHLDKTIRQRKERAKCDRLANAGGRRKMTAHERELQRLLDR
jgi:hypothetical protein